MIFFPVRFDRFHERRRAKRAGSPAIADDTKVDEPLYVSTGNLSANNIPAGHASVDKLSVCEGRASLTLAQSHLRSWQSRDQFIQHIHRLLDDPKVQVLRVDMSEVRWLDGESLAQFARAHCNASQLGKQLILEHVCDTVREIFHVTRFDRLVGLIDERRSENFAEWELEPASLSNRGR